MWIFEQSTGRLYTPDYKFLSLGYAGAGVGKNNALLQAMHNVGPIPEGLYTMLGPVNSHVHGPYAIPLTPDTTNEMFGRDGFMIHGDSMVSLGQASEGCIIQPRESRVAMWESGDHRLQVVEKLDV